MKPTGRKSKKEIEQIIKRSNAVVEAFPFPKLIKPSFLNLAQSPLERSVAMFLQRLDAAELPQTIDPLGRAFWFHCFYVPLFCLTAIRHYYTKNSELYWLGVHSTYLIAFERMLLEMNLRRGNKGKITDVRYFLTNPLEGYPYLIKRFDVWRRSAAESYTHFIRKNTGAQKIEDRRAADLAVVQRLSKESPYKLFEETLTRARSPVELKTFDKVSRRENGARWSERELDTWLIEIWPVVTEYGWNYFNVWEAANQKWDDDSPESPVATTERIENRCKNMLHLKLSVAGSSKQGRQKLRELNMLALAVWIGSIGYSEGEWMKGQIFL